MAQKDTVVEPLVVLPNSNPRNQRLRQLKGLLGKAVSLPGFQSRTDA